MSVELTTTPEVTPPAPGPDTVPDPFSHMSSSSIPESPAPPVVDPLDTLVRFTEEVREARAIKAVHSSMRFFVHTVLEHGDPVCQVCDDVHAVLSYLRNLRDNNTGDSKVASVHIFHGTQWSMTKGPHHRLVSPDKQHVYPIGYDAEQIEIDPSGSFN